MKKKIILLILLIAICVITLVYIKNKSNTKYNYEIEKVAQYNYFVYKNNDRFGVIDNTGNILVDAKYTNVIIPNPSKDVFICYNDEKVEVLNSSNLYLFKEYDLIEPVKLKSISNYIEYEKSVLVYKKNNKYGLIGYNGKIITKNKYDSIENLEPNKGKFLVCSSDKYGVIDLKGNILVKTEFDNIVSDGYNAKKDDYKKSGFIVSKKTKDGIKYGYISFQGKELLEAKYNEITRLNKEDDKNIYLISSENGKYRFL